MWFYIRLAFLITVFVSLIDANKYGEDANRPFRMNKVNLVWIKAQKRLTQKQLTELYMELKNQDEVEWLLKKKKSEDTDKDGSFEAKVRKSMLAIMEKYKLYGADGTNAKPKKILDKNKIPEPTPDPIGDIDGNSDPNLARLWNKAKRSGFTAEELLDLKEEFMNHQQKITEYKALYDQMLPIDGISDNSVESMKVLDMSVKEIKDKRQSLKQLNLEIKNSMQTLEQMTHNQQIKNKLDFTEPRVVDLWVQALKSNMTQLELASFKDELRHFEHKVKKHEYMKEKAKLEDIEMRNNVKKNEIPELPGDSMTQRAEEYQYKIKKIHADLQHKLSKHTEL